MIEKRRRPRDPNQLAKLIVDIATGQVEDKAEPAPSESFQRPCRRLAGATRRAERRQGAGGSDDAERRAEIARRAAAKRWGEARE